MDDVIVAQCGHCGARYRIEPRIEGRRARCKRCRRIFRLAPKMSLDDSVVDWLEETPDVTKASQGPSSGAS